MLTIIRGLPGSGKSTLAESIKNSHTKHVEADMFHLNEYGDYYFDRNRLKNAHAWCLLETERLMYCGNDVVVSNTFTTKKEIMPYIDLANKLVVPVQIIICSGNYKSIHNVPNEVIEAMKNRWEDFKYPESVKRIEITEKE